MSKLLVLGSSPAAVRAVELIRANDKDIDITIITFEGSFPYKRDVFPDVMQKKASVEDIYCRDKKFYEDNNIEVLTGKQITRVNLKTRKIYTEEKEHFDFDQIILAELPEGVKLTPVKGGNKEGIYALRKIKYINKLIKELPFFDTVVIQSDTFAGLKAAEALVNLGKEVYLVIPSQSPFGIIFNAEARASVLGAVAENNLHIVEDASIEEILGDAELKAVRLSSGKVLAADIVVLGEIKERLKIVDEFDLNILDGDIVVDDHYRTNISGVFAVDGLVAHHAHKWWSDFSLTKSLEDQGAKVAALITGQPYDAETFIADKRFRLGDVSISFLHGSHVNATDGCGCFTNASGDGFVGVLTHEGTVKAALLINSEEHRDAVKELIINGVNAQSMAVSLGLTEQQQEAEESHDQLDLPNVK